MDPPTSWDSLRKQARKLEAQLDEQMHLYRKLVSTKVDNSNDNDLESGIDQLLKQLQQVNVQMQAWVSSGGSEIFSHTLTRHQEIFQDLMQEFKRLHSSQRAKKEHASLLEDFREFDRTRLDLEDGGGSYDQALLKERASLHRSSGQMDSVISQAQETLKSLVFQRSTFGGINSKLSNVSSRLPTVNHILSAIKKKKSMDTIILSLVASVCTFLILIYWWTKGAEIYGFILQLYMLRNVYQCYTAVDMISRLDWIGVTVMQATIVNQLNRNKHANGTRPEIMASAILSLPFPTAAFTSRPFLDNLKANMKLGTPNQSTLSGKDYIRAKSFTRKSVTSAVEVSRFGDMTMAPPDPILGVSEAFRADTHEMKLNLGVGAYRTEDLQPYVLNVVKKAENLMLERGENKEYLPIEGLAAFNKVTAELLLGVQNDVIQQQRVATVQGLSGTGSLRLAAALIERYFPGSKVLISSPTWGNHKNIFNDARVPWSEYRYYDPRTVGLDFHGMISDIKAAPEGSFVLLHGCAHNPTGIDPTPEQWESIADVIQEKNHIPFFDVAYQGFASGSLDTDASSVRLFAACGMELLVAQSYSKNLGLYAERIGAINVVCSSSDIAQRDLLLEVQEGDESFMEMTRE
ncbi:UNVERIFIED_CONTAM: Aspartate aminotransferase, chloroplastic [Sesamum radiatum]|uniref:Aspartate aminotransferase n=1 Tax=Sesamum radiatum TaxID=300843 RepID=A0AAW2MJJ1_SESRA